MQIFCLCFLHIDTVWTKRNAVRTDFGKIIGTFDFLRHVWTSCHALTSGPFFLTSLTTGELKAALVKVLERGPRSMDEFRHVAVEVGMEVPQE